MLFLSSLVAGLPLAAAHGFVQYIKADGVQYRGYDPGFRNQNPAPKVPGWTANNPDIGFVAPTSFSSADIICHKNATPGQAYVNVRAGSTITIQWYTWPESHVGPIMDYIASCNGNCMSVDKNSLKFVKIKQGAWKSGYLPGKWVTDDLIANGFKYNLQVPSGLASGQYVLRHEIIALHGGFNLNGAQNYPQCINLNVTSGGSKTISGGTAATSFYQNTDPGIKFSVYNPITSYPYPGPPLTNL